MALNKKIVIEDFFLEEDVIAYLLENSHMVQDASKIITDNCFVDLLFKASFNAMVELSIDNKIFNRYDVFRLLKSKNLSIGVDPSHLLSLLPKGKVELPKVCGELKELEVKRIANDLSISIQQSLANGDDITKLSSVVELGLAEIQNGPLSTEIYSLDNVYESVMDKMEATAGVLKFSGVDTGSRKLNYVLGGWQPGVTIIAARPGMGKTIAGLEHAKSASKTGVKVLFLSLEMPKESLVYRYISSEFEDYKYSDLKANRISKEDVTKIRNSNARVLKQLPISFYDSDNRDVNYLNLLLIKECRKNGIGLIVIDYLQLIRDNQIKDQSDFAQVSSVSNKIQKLTRKLGIPIVALSQLSRSVESRANKHPMLSDLRSSGNIEQDAIVVILLYRDDYYKYVEAKESNQPVAQMDNKLLYIVAKNRDGEVGDVNRIVDVKTNRIADEESELFGFKEPQVAFKDSAINKIQPNFDDITIRPF